MRRSHLWNWRRVSGRVSVRVRVRVRVKVVVTVKVEVSVPMTVRVGVGMKANVRARVGVRGTGECEEEGDLARSPPFHLLSSASYQQPLP